MRKKDDFKNPWVIEICIELTSFGRGIRSSSSKRAIGDRRTSASASIWEVLVDLDRVKL
jgi:hypothetical protein